MSKSRAKQTTRKHPRARKNHAATRSDRRDARRYKTSSQKCSSQGCTHELQQQVDALSLVVQHLPLARKKCQVEPRTDKPEPFIPNPSYSDECNERAAVLNSYAPVFEGESIFSTGRNARYKNIKTTDYSDQPKKKINRQFNSLYPGSSLFDFRVDESERITVVLKDPEGSLAAHSWMEEKKRLEAQINQRGQQPFPCCPQAQRNQEVAAAFASACLICESHSKTHYGSAAGKDVATFGELTKKSLVDVGNVLTRICKLQEGDVVLDLGAGFGKPGILLALKTRLTCVGVEFIRERVRQASAVECEVLEMLVDKYPDGSTICSRFKTQHGDIKRMSSFTGATCVFAFDTAFEPELVLEIADKFNKSPPSVQWMVSNKMAAEKKDGSGCYGLRAEWKFSLRCSMSGSNEKKTLHFYKRPSCGQGEAQASDTTPVDELLRSTVEKLERNTKEDNIRWAKLTQVEMNQALDEEKKNRGTKSST